METFFKLDNKLRLAILLPIMFICFLLLFIPAIFIVKAILCLTIMFCSFLAYASLESDDIQKQNKIIEKVNNYADTKEFDYGLISNDKLNGVLINKEEEEIITYHILENRVSEKTYQFNELLEIELLTDSQSIVSVSKSGIIGGSLLGGAVFGNVGAVIGALSANKNISEKISKITMSFTFDNLDEPSYNLTLNEFGIPQNMDSETVRIVMEEIDIWLKRFNVILKRNEKLNNIN